MTEIKNLEEIALRAEKDLSDIFRDIDRISEVNTAKVLDAFREFSVSEGMLAPSTGYGYGDRGRDTLDEIYARVFDTEAALVRHNIVNGTHALTIGLFGLLRPGDIMLSVTGKPYDTLETVIGISGEKGVGSLRDFGIEYAEVPFADGGLIDFDGIEKKLSEFGGRIKVVFIQRSKGYMTRPTLTVSQIGDIAEFVHERSGAYVVVDNCYGEFTQTSEPCSRSANPKRAADLIIGSLIKNPGGGLAESGGYLAGTKKAVELVSYRQTCPGIGNEAGATLGQNRRMFQGFFFAPHVVAQALKTAHFAAYIFENLGFDVYPSPFERRSDIIQTVKTGSAEALCAFCRGIQSGSPIDAYVTPEPWDMPGYNDAVIMAAGTFVSGASIELSADGPMREPYTVFFQGGLTFESGKYGILKAAEQVLSSGK